jgi:hypothetical protein
MFALPPDMQVPLFAALGVLVLAGIAYVWQWSAGRAEVKRYTRGFVLTTCPVCEEGRIHLEETVRSMAGISWVRRSARCDTCNSVLRELRPGLWRYSVDAYANPQMAERFKRQRATTAELEMLARDLERRPPKQQLDEVTTESLDLSWLEIDEPLGSDELKPEAPPAENPEAPEPQPKLKRRSAKKSSD